jgi:hypothetical protein
VFIRSGPTTNGDIAFGKEYALALSSVVTIAANNRGKFLSFVPYHIDKTINCSNFVLFLLLFKVIVRVNGILPTMKT